MATDLTRRSPRQSHRSQGPQCNQPSGCFLFRKVTTRASTTKNRKDAVVPLHPSLAAELRQSIPKNADPSASVFPVNQHMCRTFKKDLERAKIARFDAMKRKLDFHALRYTFATRLALKGVSQGLTQELMRLSDANLAAKVYTN